MTKEVPVPPPPQGAVIDTFSGSGNQVTPSFNVPQDGDYIVTWAFFGNVDTSFGGSNPSNFIVRLAREAGLGGLADDSAKAANPVE